MITAQSRLYLTIALVVIVLAAFGGLTVHYVGLKRQAAKVPGLELTIKQRDNTIATMRRDHAKTQLASKGYQDELDRLRAAGASRPAPRIRVCNDTPGVRAEAGAKPGPHEGTAAGGVLSEAPGRDIGPALAVDADLADALSAQIRGLHTYINTVCTQ